MTFFESGLHDYIREAKVEYVARLGNKIYNLLIEEFPEGMKSIDLLFKEQNTDQQDRPLRYDDLKSAFTLAKTCLLICFTILLIELAVIAIDKKLRKS